MRLLVTALALLAASPTFAATPALHEVNAARAARGLPPFAEDPALTAAAMSAADYRAAHRIAGHVSGNLGDFGFLPAGAHADAAGCGALEPSWGWGTCCTYERWTHAGAALAVGTDGKRYMHLFVRYDRRDQHVATAPPVPAPAQACPCAAGCSCPAPCDCLTHAALYDRTAAGKETVVAVGVPSQHGCARVAPLPGLTPGLYRCYKEPLTGRQLMQVGEYRKVCDGKGSCVVTWVDLLSGTPGR